MKHAVALLALFGFIAFFGCEENQITYEDLTPPFSKDSLRIEEIASHTYMTPPSMGSFSRLYLGDVDQFSNPFILLTVNRYSSGLAMETLLDTSLVQIDSILLKIISSDTTLPTMSEYSIFHFPNSGDSVYNELKTHYQNSPEAQLESEKVFVSDTSFFTQVDSIYNDDSTEVDVENTYSLRFKFPPSFLSQFADTSSSASKNRTLMITPPADYTDLAAFYSRESGNGAVFYIHYHDEVEDSLIKRTRSFAMSSDLNMVVPPSLAAEDTNHITLSRGKGLQSVLQFSMDHDAFIDPILISKANLVLWEADTTIPDHRIRLLTLSEEPPGFESSYDEDPYAYFLSSSYIVNGTASKGKLVMDVKSILQEMVMGNISNHGFKIISTASNPFDLFYFMSPDSPENAPYLEVEYVKE